MSGPLRLALVFVVLSLVAAACAGPAEDETEIAIGNDQDEGQPDEVARTTMVPTMRPSSAEELGIVLDRFGRPYDNYVGPQGFTTEERLIGRLTSERARLYLLGGEAFLSPAAFAATDRKAIDFGRNNKLDVRIIFRRPDGPDVEPVETVLAVRIGVRDAVVETWGPFREAYTTTDGLGGVITRTALDYARFEADPDLPVLVDGRLEGRAFQFADLAGEQGRDLVLFENGAGAGTYSYSEGRNEDGRLVAIMLWHPGYPWRLAVPDGEPPPDITEREDQLQGCIDGTRTIDRWGRCT